MANDGSSPKTPNAGDTTLDSDATTAAISTLPSLPLTFNPQSLMSNTILTESIREKGSPSMEIIIGNEDLTTLILLRLPVKSLLRFKAVCKQWYSIISTLRFRQIHASDYGADAATGVFLNINTRKLGFISLDNHTSPMHNLGQHSRILSSSGGLILLLLKFRDFCVCNPTTNEIQFLDVPQVIRDLQDDYNDEDTTVSATLAFDPSKSVHYKVLFVLDDLESVIYSSETRTFRSLEITNNLLDDKGVYWNDAIQWISYGGEHVSYFDLSKECMNHYSSLNDIGDLLYYAESQGNLHAVSLVDTETEFEFEVYELKRDYSGWSLKGKVDIDSILLEEPSISQGSCSDVAVSSILEDEKGGLTLVFVVNARFITFVVFDVLEKKLINVLRHKGDLSYAGHHYKPTLALVLG